MTNGKLKTMCALMAGAAVGAACGVLYAPQTGKRTRRDLRRYADRKLDQLDEIQDSVHAYTTECVSEVKHAANACIKKARQNVVESGEALVEAMDGIRKLVDSNTRRFERYVLPGAR